jgi:hypothetical protein
VRYAALAPAEAKKNVIDQRIVIVVALRLPWTNRPPVTSRSTPETM